MCSGCVLVSILGEVEVEQASSGGQDRYSIIVAYRYSVHLSTILSPVITYDSHVIGARLIVKGGVEGQQQHSHKFQLFGVRESDMRIL